MISETTKIKSKFYKNKSSLNFTKNNLSSKPQEKTLSTQRKESNINSKFKIIPNTEEINKKMNMTNFASFPSPKNSLLNSIKLPLLLSKSKSKEDLRQKNLTNKEEERINNYKKMRRYRIKLVKVPKSKKKIDNVYKLFKENGLQFLFPPEKINKNNNNKNEDDKNQKPKIKDKKKEAEENRMKKLRMSISTKNIKNMKYKLISPHSNSNNLKIYQRKPEEEEELFKPSFKKYMKLQSLADLKFHPVLGESSSDLVHFLNKIEFIRKEVINKYIDEINNVENRFNIERPKEDFRFKTKMQGLYHHKWKNIFSLKDYQELFCENLKGKISSRNYDIMERNFRNIFLMCFASGSYKNNMNNFMH